MGGWIGGWIGQWVTGWVEFKDDIFDHLGYMGMEKSCCRTCRMRNC